jgi:hypothetical protein
MVVGELTRCGVVRFSAVSGVFFCSFLGYGLFRRDSDFELVVRDRNRRGTWYDV